MSRDSIAILSAKDIDADFYGRVNDWEDWNCGKCPQEKRMYCQQRIGMRKLIFRDLWEAFAKWN